MPPEQRVTIPRLRWVVLLLLAAAVIVVIGFCLGALLALLTH